MKIIKGSEAIDVQHPVFMIFGQPGIGKSTLAYSMKDVLALDFDLGAHRAVNRRDTVQISVWAQVEEILKDRTGLEPYAALAVDTVGRCLDVITADIAEKEPKKAPGGNLSLQGFGVLKNRFRQFIGTVRALGKDMLLVSHDREDKDGDLRIVRPDITGGSYGEVMRNSDFVGYLQMVGKDRVLDFNPTDRWVGKNPAGWAPFKLPEAAKATEFLAKLYTKGREALGHISEVSANVTQQVDEWRTKIAGYKTAADYNAGLQACLAMSPILKPQVGKMLIDCAKSAGVTYDKGAKCFVDPKPTPSEADALETMLS